MFKVRPVIVISLNILLMLVSWICYKFPHGDEYLFLFMIPLVFIIVPFVMTLPLIAALLAADLLFFTFYRFIGVLNWIDILVLMTLLISVIVGGYLVKFLYRSFVLYHEQDILGRQRRYNSIVSELQAADRRGKRIESELSRISRLYEITKKLAPSLKFDDLMNMLFDFLENNFKFQATHLLMFNKGKFARGISKSVGYEDYYEDSEMILEYKKVVEYAKKRDLKPFFADRGDETEMFDSLKVRGDSFMVFPLFLGDRICAILAIEGASRQSFGRFRILIPQIALEFRKVELYEQVQELSIIDGLTEVYLRRYLMDRMEEEVDRAKRLGLTFSIGMIDVDHFKECNDKYGHLVGDAVLKKIAEKLKYSVREVDMIARYGGEEFCVVLPETVKDLALSVAERLRKAIESERIRAFDEKIRMTVSVGISTYPEDG
ncbi:MAG: GGDEF domain-containing protein, partial [Candidatus Omnitrophota bacterium]|nr:GGDEF domain-containing protein [Candidatus Omnitrophota bacterium]